MGRGQEVVLEPCVVRLSSCSSLFQLTLMAFFLLQTAQHRCFIHQCHLRLFCHVLRQKTQYFPVVKHGKRGQDFYIQNPRQGNSTSFVNNCVPFFLLRSGVLSSTVGDRVLSHPVASPPGRTVSQSPPPAPQEWGGSRDPAPGARPEQLASISEPDPPGQAEPIYLFSPMSLIDTQYFRLKFRIKIGLIFSPPSCLHHSPDFADYASDRLPLDSIKAQRSLGGL